MAAEAFKTTLENFGYRNVEIKEAEPPDHVIEWARGDDEEMTDEDVAEVTPYYKVISDQGSFGIVMGPYILLDLKETGFSARDLGDVEASEDQFLTNFNSLTLKHLKLLLEMPKQ